MSVADGNGDGISKSDDIKGNHGYNGNTDEIYVRSPSPPLILKRKLGYNMESPKKKRKIDRDKCIFNVPEWARLPPNEYNFELEIIDNGVIKGRINLNNNSYHIFGRDPNVCDVVGYHESISRQHCVLVHRKNGEFFVFDFGSTHFTRICKNKIYPHKFYKINIGMFIRLGLSKTMYILNGPQHLMDKNNNAIKKDLMIKSKNMGNDNDLEIIRMEKKLRILEDKKKEMEIKYAEILKSDDDNSNVKASEWSDKMDELNVKINELKSKIKKKKYFDDNFDDNDDYYDRTKYIKKTNDKKDKKRLSYNDVVTKLDDINIKITEIEQGLRDIEYRKNDMNNTNDDYDSVLDKMKYQYPIQKYNELKHELKELKINKAKYEKLYNVLKPAYMKVIQKKQDNNNTSNNKSGWTIETTTYKKPKSGDLMKPYIPAIPKTVPKNPSPPKVINTTENSKNMDKNRSKPETLAKKLSAKEEFQLKFKHLAGII